MSTKFVFFDLGNVILEFSHDLACRQLADRGKGSFSTVKRVLFEDGLEDQLESGLISEAQFCQTLREQAEMDATDALIIEAISDIFTPNLTVFPIIGQLSAVGFPLGIMSNTCAAHWNWVCSKYSILVQCFPIHVLSYRVESMKPDPKIYQEAIRQGKLAADCEPDEIFFVDDKPVNVAGALSAGLDAIVYESANQLRTALEQRGVRFNL